MKTSEMVIDWLEAHMTPEAKEVSEEEYGHFVAIVSEVATCCVDKKVADSAKWIRENVSDGVAVDYLKAMK